MDGWNTLCHKISWGTISRNKIFFAFRFDNTQRLMPLYAENHIKARACERSNACTVNMSHNLNVRLTAEFKTHEGSWNDRIR